MTRSRRCRICKGWHDLDRHWPEACLAHWGSQPKRSDFAAPTVISDAQPPLRSMADGKVYESKSAMRRSYTPTGNPSGNRYLEIGNETPPPKPVWVDKPGIRRAVQKAAQDFNQGRRAGQG